MHTHTCMRLYAFRLCIYFNISFSLHVFACLLLLLTHLCRAVSLFEWSRVTAEHAIFHFQTIFYFPLSGVIVKNHITEVFAILPLFRKTLGDLLFIFCFLFFAFFFCKCILYNVQNFYLFYNCFYFLFVCFCYLITANIETFKLKASTQTCSRAVKLYIVEAYLYHVTSDC